MVMDAAAVHREVRKPAFAFVIAIQTDIAGEDIHIVERVVLRLVGLQIDTVPTASCIEVRHAVKQPVKAVSAEEDRRL